MRFRLLQHKWVEFSFDRTSVGRDFVCSDMGGLSFRLIEHRWDGISFTPSSAGCPSPGISVRIELQCSGDCNMTSALSGF